MNPNRVKQTFNQHTFDSAIAPLYPYLRSYAALRVGVQDAPDMVQQALIAAWLVRERFDARRPSAELLLWLKRFVDHMCREHLRKLNRTQARQVETEGCEHTLPLEELPELRAEQTPDVELYRNELRRLLCITPLTSRQRLCLLAWLNGDTQQQIAARLGIRGATVWEHIGAAVERLKKNAVCPRIEAQEAFCEDGNRSLYHAPEPAGARITRDRVRRQGRQEAKIHPKYTKIE